MFKVNRIHGVQTLWITPSIPTILVIAGVVFVNPLLFWIAGGLALIASFVHGKAMASDEKKAGKG